MARQIRINMVGSPSERIISLPHNHRLNPISVHSATRTGTRSIEGSITAMVLSSCHTHIEEAKKVPSDGGQNRQHFEGERERQGRGEEATRERGRRVYWPNSGSVLHARTGYASVTSEAGIDKKMAICASWAS
eukprot:1939170-Prymnesium_polylepis.1